MEIYKHIGYYNDNADIVDIIKSKLWYRNDGLIAYLKEGKGNFHGIEPSDDYATLDELKQREPRRSCQLTEDKKYIVSFLEGDTHELGRFLYDGVEVDESDNMGFLVDIYELSQTDELTITDDGLNAIISQRELDNKRLKTAIKDEFKACFEGENEGLDFYAHSPYAVYAQSEYACGTISRMYLDEDGYILVDLDGEFGDNAVDFEDRRFIVEDWPSLLRNVRDGIRNNWLIEEED